METLPGVAPPEQQNTYFYIGQHETRRTVPVTTELGNQAQDAGVSEFFMFWSGWILLC
jgi:protein arginine N-methyltransferase 5